MAGTRTRGLGLLVMLWLVSMATIAQAAVRTNRTPTGWDAAPRAEARERAERWASTLGARLQQTFGTRTEDQFVETLAVLEIPGVMNVGEQLDPEAELSRALEPLFDGEPSSVDVSSEGTTVLITGEWVEGDITYEVAVASAGPMRGVIILAVRSSEASLYGQVFEEFLGGITGLASPIAPFDHARFQWSTAIGWALFFGLCTLVVSTTGLGAGGPEDAGRIVALVCVVVALIGAGIAFVLLADEEGRLALAGLDRSLLAVEFAGIGLLLAAASWGIGRLRARTVSRVESAPTGGAFAGRPAPERVGLSAQTMNANLVPPTSKAALTSPGHGMTPEDLATADAAAIAEHVNAMASSSPSKARREAEFDRAWAEAEAADDAEDAPTNEVEVPRDPATPSEFPPPMRED
ncbi:MAG: hypothetical protein AAGA54_07920 [Myxococcota bacterium]